MHHQLKRYVKLLAERFAHEIDYENDEMLFSNAVNKVRVFSKTKDLTRLDYNADGETISLELDETSLIDMLVEILRREKTYPVKLKTGFVLDLAYYLDSEGKYAQRDMETLRKAIRSGDAKNSILFGNRIEAEYYKGILILTDDLGYRRSTVIPFP